MLSLLRDLQPIVIKHIQKTMALTLDIKNDFFYQQGAKEMKIQIAVGLIKKGLDKNLIAEATGLTISEIDRLEKEQKKKRKE